MLLTLSQALFTAAEVIGPTVEVLLFLEKPLLHLERLGLGFPRLLLGFGPDLDGFFFRFEEPLFQGALDVGLDPRAQSSLVDRRCGGLTIPGQ